MPQSRSPLDASALMAFKRPVMSSTFFLLGFLASNHATFSLAQTLVALGDSYADTGLKSEGPRVGFSDWAQQTLNTSEVFPPLPYVGGRYCNGKIWLEHAQQSLGFTLLSFAVSGATSGVGLSVAGTLPLGAGGYPDPVKVLAPNLGQQLDQYYSYCFTSKNCSLQSDIYLINVGINDYISITTNNKTVNTSDVISAIDTALNSLYQQGARRFFLVTILPIPALGEFYSNRPSAAENWNAHNAALNSLASNFLSSHNGSTVNVFDFGSVALNITQDPQKYDFSTKDRCYPLEGTDSDICTDPDKRVYWDYVHLSTVAQERVANAFVREYGSLFKNQTVDNAG